MRIRLVTNGFAPACHQRGRLETKPAPVRTEQRAILPLCGLQIVPRFSSSFIPLNPLLRARKSTAPSKQSESSSESVFDTAERGLMRILFFWRGFLQPRLHTNRRELIYS